VATAALRTTEYTKPRTSFLVPATALLRNQLSPLRTLKRDARGLLTSMSSSGIVMIQTPSLTVTANRLPAGHNVTERTERNRHQHHQLQFIIEIVCSLIIIIIIIIIQSPLNASTLCYFVTLLLPRSHSRTIQMHSHSSF